MRTQLVGRKIAMPIAILLTLLAGSESGFASNNLARGRGPRIGSTRVFTPAQANFSERDVKLVIVREIAAHQDHAIVAVRFNGGSIVLDNRWLALITTLSFDAWRRSSSSMRTALGDLASGSLARFPVGGLDKVERQNDPGCARDAIECALRRS